MNTPTVVQENPDPTDAETRAQILRWTVAGPKGDGDAAYARDMSLRRGTIQKTLVNAAGIYGYQREGD